MNVDVNIEQLYSPNTPYTEYDDWDGFSATRGRSVLDQPQQSIEFANSVLVHYSNAEFRSLGKARLADLGLRSVRAMLERYRELNQEVGEQPIAGRCRDLALIICGQFRAQGVPARLRYGFTHMYYKTNLALTDHVVVEYRDQGEWKILEPRGTRQLIELKELDIDPLDVERRRFIHGALAWNRVRHKAMRAEWFSGAAPNAEMGLWYVRKIMLYDLASLCRYEPDVFDTWGYLTDSKPGVMPKFKPHLRALDEISEVDLDDNAAFAELYRLLVTDERFLPDGTVTVNPIIGKSRQYTVSKASYAIY